MDLPTAIARVIDRSDLTRSEMIAVMTHVMTGEASPAQIGGLLVGLRMKGESIDEIVGAATVMRELATPVEVSAENLVDTCGTGGSGSNKFNVSTASAFVAAAAGARVAKHGNRAASGKSGSADVLEVAGANIMLDASNVARCIDEVGLGFLFALNHHGAMKHAIGPRKEMVVRTIFNMLGPLTNPAGAKRQLLGVYDKSLLVPIANVLRELGSEHVMVVHSDDGLDEISISANTKVAELKDGVISEYEISPADFGFKLFPLDQLKIENSEQSLELVKASLNRTHEGAANIVLMNAGATIYVSGISDSLESGVEEAMQIVDSGQAVRKMQEFVDYTNALANEDAGAG
jgi:anthranilate phosphoribosyltransferase